jgi:GH3 auxin-responsive promoter
VIATLANSAWLASCIPEYLRFRRALGRVRTEQERVLRGILRKNQASAFGHRHGFSAIHTVRDYQRHVPLSDYDDYRASIARIAEGATRVLTCERVHLFEPTSGSSSPAKWIPYTASLKHEFQRGIRAWIADLFLHDADLLHGPGYWSVSPAQAREEVTPSGIPVGFAHDSEYVGGLQQRLVRSVMAVPSSVRHSRNMEAFWYLTLRHLVRRPDLRLISVWNPSFLTLLVDQLSEHGDRLLDEEPTLKPALRARTAAERHALLWPRLRMISCWADGNSGSAARRLAALFPQARIRAKGLIATEGFVSLPWEGCDGAVLAVRSHFLEFLPVDSVGRPDATRPHLADELEPGQAYSVVLTTGAGLYRYHLGDVVTVLGRKHDCPFVRFIGRKGVADWCGEKIHEVQAARIIESAFTARRLAPSFAMLACDTSGEVPNYVLYVEAVASEDELGGIGASIECALEENFHYRYARRLGQLGPLRVFAARNAEASYLAACMAGGQRAGDVKCVALDPRDGWTPKFEGHFAGTRTAAGSPS